MTISDDPPVLLAMLKRDGWPTYKYVVPYLGAVDADDQGLIQDIAGRILDRCAERFAEGFGDPLTDPRAVPSDT